MLIGPCAAISLFTCVYLTAIIIARRYTPISIGVRCHLTLLVGYLTAAADIVDFAEHSKNEAITNAYGVDLIRGSKNKILLMLCNHN